METKTCSLCNITKPIEEFYYGMTKCKYCKHQVRKNMPKYKSSRTGAGIKKYNSELLDQVKTYIETNGNMSKASKEYNVSYNAIRKWCKDNNIRKIEQEII